MERIAIFAALPWECAPIAKRLRRAQRTAINACTVWRGDSERGEVWLVKTGIGLNHAHAAAQAVAEAGEFTLFLSTGCAGALAADLRPGDLNVATRVVSMMTSQPLATDVERSADVLAAAQRAGVQTCSGTVLCSPAVLATRSEKRNAAQRYGAVAVEMEGQPLAVCAANAGIPFVSARVILDDAQTEMRHAGRFVDPQSGRVRPMALAAYVARRPSVVRELLALQRMMQAAQRSLDQLFAIWLTNSRAGAARRSVAALAVNRSTP